MSTSGYIYIYTNTLYVADDGKIFVGCGVGEPFGPECNKGLLCCVFTQSHTPLISHLVQISFCVTGLLLFQVKFDFKRKTYGYGQ